jgi:hypothetical protein
VVGRALGASAEGEWRALVVEVVLVRQPRFILALLIITFHIVAAESCGMAPAFIGAWCAGGADKHESGCKKRGREPVLDRQEENGEIDGSAGEAVLVDTQQW